VRAGRILPALGLACLAIAAPSLAVSQSASSAQTPQTILGVWRTPSDGGSTVRISACGDAVCGQILSSPTLRANPNQQDARNSDPALRARRLQGLRILQVRPQGPGRWSDGWVYNPTDGKTYRGSITLTQDGRLRLTGCVVRPLCQTQTWTRVAD
jgi:uncharacterized protein (DUF2147 family)